MVFLKQLFNNNKVYLIGYFILLVILVFVLITGEKGEIHIAINKYHSTVTDYFFKYFTNFGDGVVPFILTAIFLFFSIRNALLIFLSGSLAGLLAQFFKHVVFYDAERPIKYLADYPLHLIDGVNMHTMHSFPSGHSATIFALCLSMAVQTSSLFLKIVLFCTAVLVAFSRVYLSQHFLVDAYAGSIIGTLSAIIVIYFISRQKALWLDISLPEIIKSKTK